jgi:hypothetical protein
MSFPWMGIVGVREPLSSGILDDGVEAGFDLSQQRTHGVALAAGALTDPHTKVSQGALGTSGIILDATHLASVDAVAVEGILRGRGGKGEGEFVAHACSIGGEGRLSSDEVSVSYTLLSF